MGPGGAHFGLVRGSQVEVAELLHGLHSKWNFAAYQGRHEVVSQVGELVLGAPALLSPPLLQTNF